MFNYEMFFIKNLTNLHVGSGDSNFGVVDNLVQKDVITNVPIISSSSLKGAIRDYFRQKGDSFYSDICKCCFDSLFGLEDSKEEDKECEKFPKFGLVSFLDAKLLFLPLRTNHKKSPYVLATSKFVIEEFIKTLNELELSYEENIKNLLKEENIVEGMKNNEYLIEDTKVKEEKIENLSKIKEFFKIDKNIPIAVLTKEEFSYYAKNLPVVARNKLDNGKSKNLWYEEIVPRESIFYTIFGIYKNLGDEDKDKFLNAYKKFKNTLLNEKVQIGANISIGYGVCKFYKGNNNEK